MANNQTGPEWFSAANSYIEDINEGEAEYASAEGVSVDNRMLYATLAQVHATQASTAMLKVIAEILATGMGVGAFDLETWDEVIPSPPLKECKGKEIRRPACEERHTEDCAYADPVPEPKHVLLDVGTRVLVSPTMIRHSNGKIEYDEQPWTGQIAGYDMSRSKYRINEERYGTPGEYYDFIKWAAVDNRVQPHPEQPEPKPVEPTGPRIYVQNHHGKQGYVTEVYHHEKDDTLWYRVQFFSPGAEPVLKRADSLTPIAPSQVERCPNGQTRDECESGENQCELCLQAEDEEGDMIEESMGLRSGNPHSPGCPPIKHRH